MADEDPLNSEERAYFDSRGARDIPAPAEAPATPEPAPREAGEAGTSSAPTDTTPKAEADTPAETGKSPTDTQLRGALAEERKRRKELDERLRQSELLQARMEERFNMLRTPAAAPAAPKPPPRPDQDIFGAVDHTMKALDGVTKKITEYEQNERNKMAAQQLVDWTTQHEQAFAVNVPDYYAALQHTGAVRAMQLQALKVPPAQISKQLKTEAHQLMAHAARIGANPAEMAYALAKTYGYSKQAVPAPAAVPDPSRQLDAVEAGQGISGSLSSVGGKSGNGVEVTLADLAKMNEKDFVTFMRTKPGQFRRLKGADH